nr:hypothetical protein [Tanacetum cinerariifolium]
YEAEVQKKPNSNSQDMAFISSSKNSNNEDGNTTSSGRELERRLAYKDQMWQALTNLKLSASIVTRWVRTGKKISIQGSDVAGFDKSKVECFNYHKMGHFVRECRASRSQERVRKESYRQGSKAEEKSSKELMAIDGVGWDWSYMANEEDHALVADGETPTEFALMANNENKIKKQTSEVETLQEEKDVVDGKNNAVPPPAADLYLSPKKDPSWTGLPEFVDDTVTDYSRPSPTVASTSSED